MALRTALMRLSRVESETIAAAPYRRNKIVLADDAIAVFDQVDQNIEYLRLDRNKLVAPPQFTPVRVEHTILETYLQMSLSSVGLFPNRFQVRRSTLGRKKALDFFETEGGPDTPRFGQGRACFYLAVEP